jgi:hypothetical protein
VATGPQAAIRLRWASSCGPGSTTTQDTESGDRSTHVLVPSSVITDGLSASITEATGVTLRSTP